MFNIKNISKNRSVVCTLNDGTSLRLLPQSEVTIKDNQITDYLKGLSKMKNPIIIIGEQTVKSVNEKEGDDEPKEEKATKKTLKQK